MAAVAHIAGVAPRPRPVSDRPPPAPIAAPPCPALRRLRECAANDDDALESVATTGRSMNSSRRGFLSAAASIATTALSRSPASRSTTPLPTSSPSKENFWAKATREAHPERWYPYWWALPLAPYGSKATAMGEVVPGRCGRSTSCRVCWTCS